MAGLMADQMDDAMVAHSASTMVGQMVLWWVDKTAEW